VFDVFGTVVDWEGSMTRQLTVLAESMSLLGVDWLAFAREWRAGYRYRT
jgi:hypothetical protein